MTTLNSISAINHRMCPTKIQTRHGVRPLSNGDVFGIWYFAGNIAGIWLGLKVQSLHNLQGGVFIWFAVLMPWALGILLGYLNCRQRKNEDLGSVEANFDSHRN
jgi:hypothetical protein